MTEPTKVDLINHPPHYTQSGVEPIDVIEAWDLGFCLGNTVKYIARHQHKGTPLADLKKAQWYLNRQIATMEWLERLAAEAKDEAEKKRKANHDA